MIFMTLCVECSGGAVGTVGDKSVVYVRDSQFRNNRLTCVRDGSVCFSGSGAALYADAGSTKVILLVVDIGPV